ncbi:MAG TPA: polysaccharide deacetylase family protein [Bacilli bacterium]|nr:polysaccharide deacetylase family protein [Bacilli bacterium]
MQTEYEGQKKASRSKRETSPFRRAAWVAATVAGALVLGVVGVTVSAKWSSAASYLHSWGTPDDGFLNRARLAEERGAGSASAEGAPSHDGNPVARQWGGLFVDNTGGQEQTAGNGDELNGAAGSSADEGQTGVAGSSKGDSQTGSDARHQASASVELTTSASGTASSVSGNRTGNSTGSGTLDGKGTLNGNGQGTEVQPNNGIGTGATGNTNTTTTTNTTAQPSTDVPGASATPSEQSPQSDKVVYLTFDDGPNSYTPQILDTLKKENVKATFFVLSGQVRQYADTVKRIHEEGHVIGLHGVTHRADKIYQSPATVVAEMNACNTAVEAVIGEKTDLIRVPFGSVPYMKQPYRDAVVKAGYHLWDWNVDSYDSRAASVPSDRIIAEVKKQTADKTNAVILFHDKETTAAALPAILTYLKAQGFSFRTLSDDIEPLNFWNDER